MLTNIRKRFHRVKYLYTIQLQQVTPWFMHEKPVKVVWRRGSKRNRRGVTSLKSPTKVEGNEVLARLDVEETFELDVTLYAESSRTRKTGPYGKKDLRLAIMEMDEDGSFYSILGAVTIKLNELVGLINHELKLPLECDKEISEAVGPPHFHINVRSFYKKGNGGSSISSGITSSGWTQQGSDSDEVEDDHLIFTNPDKLEAADPVKLIDDGHKDNADSKLSMESVPENPEDRVEEISQEIVQTAINNESENEQTLVQSPFEAETEMIEEKTELVVEDDKTKEEIISSSSSAITTPSSAVQSSGNSPLSKNVDTAKTDHQQAEPSELETLTEQNSSNKDTQLLTSSAVVGNISVLGRLDTIQSEVGGEEEDDEITLSPEQAGDSMEMIVKSGSSGHIDTPSKGEIQSTSSSSKIENVPSLKSVPSFPVNVNDSHSEEDEKSKEEIRPEVESKSTISHPSKNQTPSKPTSSWFSFLSCMPGGRMVCCQPSLPREP